MEARNCKGDSGFESRNVGSGWWCHALSGRCDCLCSTDGRVWNLGELGGKVLEVAWLNSHWLVWGSGNTIEIDSDSSIIAILKDVESVYTAKGFRQEGTIDNTTAYSALLFLALPRRQDVVALVKLVSSSKKPREELGGGRIPIRALGSAWPCNLGVFLGHHLGTKATSQRERRVIQDIIWEAPLSRSPPLAADASPLWYHWQRGMRLDSQILLYYYRMGHRHEGEIQICISSTARVTLPSSVRRLHHSRLVAETIVVLVCRHPYLCSYSMILRLAACFKCVQRLAEAYVLVPDVLSRDAEHLTGMAPSIDRP